MPPKKKGKASKFARMSEEERARYLQHRAEIELEAKRRKQQLVAVFTKNKLKREEVFSRLNTAKLNEQWRFILRKIKCKELHDDVEYLSTNFNRVIVTKDLLITQLYNELELADKDHRSFQESHIEFIDSLIKKYRERLRDSYEWYSKALEEIQNNDVVKLLKLRRTMEEDFKDLEAVIFTQGRNLEAKLMETKSRNIVNTYTIERNKEEEMRNLTNWAQREAHELWKEMDNVVEEYERSTERKREQYEYLKELDDKASLESKEFPKIQQRLLSNVDYFKNNISRTLVVERGTNIKSLKNQLESLNKTIVNLRRNERNMQTQDASNLKLLANVSNNVTKELERISEKAAGLQTLMKLCKQMEAGVAFQRSCNESSSSMQEENAEEEEKETRCRPIEPFDKMWKFWNRYNHVKAENIFMKEETARLAAENKRLRNSLRTYLITIARVPVMAMRPRTCI